MRPDGSITHWIFEIKDGNPAAAQALWERYFQRLVRLARKELNHSDRRVSDEEDVVVNVFDSFCRKAEEGKFPNLSDRHGLWRLLVRMTARKAIDQKRTQSRLCRGGGKLRGESAIPGAEENEMAIAAVIGEEPTPEFISCMREQIGKILAILDSDELAELAKAKMEGFTNNELAKKYECSERTIERRLKLIRAKCEREGFD